MDLIQFVGTGLNPFDLPFSSDDIKEHRSELIDQIVAEFNMDAGDW